MCVSRFLFFNKRRRRRTSSQSPLQQTHVHTYAHNNNHLELFVVAVVVGLWFETGLIFHTHTVEETNTKNVWNWDVSNKRIKIKRQSPYFIIRSYGIGRCETFLFSTHQNTHTSFYIYRHRFAGYKLMVAAPRKLRTSNVVVVVVDGKWRRLLFYSPASCFPFVVMTKKRLVLCHRKSCEKERRSSVVGVVFKVVFFHADDANDRESPWRLVYSQLVPSFSYLIHLLPKYHQVDLYNKYRNRYLMMWRATS